MTVAVAVAVTVTRHDWQFRRRFRRNAFGWKSQPAVARIKEAVSEIRKAARKDPVLAAEGAVLLIERLSPALAHVDSSSGAIGGAVNRAIATLVPLIAQAPADGKTRAGWLDRLWTAYIEDQIPYLETLADLWGELCASPEAASSWADRLLDETREALDPDKRPRAYSAGASVCLAALFAAGRHGELLAVLEPTSFWPYRSWAVKALAAKGRIDEAVREAEGCRSPWASDDEIDILCEEILLAAGRVDDAYERYALSANRKTTYLAWFRAVVGKYPGKPQPEILRDLVEADPARAGNWFAAAKSAELYEEAIDLANRTPCSPHTLTRAARDFATSRPDFALEAGIAALKWLVLGYGYEITGKDVREAWNHTMQAAGNAKCEQETRQRVRELVASETFGERFVTRILGRELGLS